MDSKSYFDTLKIVLKMAIKDIIDDPRYEESTLLQGQKMGLMIALEKLERSKFLIEENE